METGLSVKASPAPLGCSHADHWLAPMMSHIRFIVIHPTASLCDREPGDRQTGKTLVYLIIERNQIFQSNLRNHKVFMKNSKTLRVKRHKQFSPTPNKEGRRFNVLA